MAKTVSALTEKRRKEVVRSFQEGVTQDDLEMMKAHFESHPTMPGEKEFKKTVNTMLEGGDYDAGQAENLAEQYAATAIRETKFSGSVVNVLKSSTTDPETGKTTRKYKEPEENKFQLKSIEGYQGVETYSLDVELRKVKDGVNIYAKRTPDAAKFTKVGTVPDNFLTNNPMNVSRCSAEICVEDYSGGKLRNVSERLVVDSDVMSGDKVELNNDMLAGLDNTTNLEQ